MVVRLSRSKLAQVCKAFDGGELGARSFYGTTAPTVFFVKNAGLVSINEGAPLSLSGFATSSLAYPKAVSRMNNGALVLSGTVPGSNVHAVALDRIAPGKIGRAASLGLCFHAVTINDASHVYADASFSSSASAAFYDIVAKSATSGGVAVCALYHAASGGGGPIGVTVLTGISLSVSANVLTITITSEDI